MKKVKRANVVLQIEDEEVDKYLSVGYALIDESGNVVKEGLANDVNELQRNLIAARKTISELTEKIKMYETKLNEKKSSKKQTKEE